MTTRTSTKQLVKNIMTAKPLCVSMGTTVRELAELLIENEISGAPVIDMQERVVGVVSKTDLLDRCLHQASDSAGSFMGTLAEGLEIEVEFNADELGTVEEFMSVDPVTVAPDDPATAVARRMAEERIHRVIVVDDERRVCGIVTSLDMLRAMSA